MVKIALLPLTKNDPTSGHALKDIFASKIAFHYIDFRVCGLSLTKKLQKNSVVKKGQLDSISLHNDNDYILFTVMVKSNGNAR